MKHMKLALWVLVAVCTMAVAGSAQAPAGVRGWFLNEVNGLEKKLVGLAEAMPADKYTWRPGEGVRSVSEVYLHVSIGNFRIPTAIGAKPPAGLEPKGFEKSTTEKAKVIEYLKQSLEHLRMAANSISDADLDKTTKLFGREATYRDVLLLLTTHLHEHLGQSIAYARMNKVTPPWSEK